VKLILFIMENNFLKAIYLLLYLIMFCFGELEDACFFLVDWRMPVKYEFSMEFGDLIAVQENGEQCLCKSY